MFRRFHKAKSPHERNEFFNMHFDCCGRAAAEMEQVEVETNVDCVDNIGFSLAIGGSFCSVRRRRRCRSHCRGADIARSKVKPLSLVAFAPVFITSLL